MLLVAATAVSVGLALWANRERRRAEDREQLAIGAVKRYGDVVRETRELKDDPRLAELRSTLLKEPQAFFQTLRDRLLADRETTPESLARLAQASFDLGVLTNEIGNKQDALRTFEESLAIRERLARDRPSDMEFRSELARSHHSIGTLQSEMGRPVEALASYEQARMIRERLVSSYPTVTQFQRDLARSYHGIGVLQRDTGRPADALKSYEQDLAISARLRAKTRRSPRSRATWPQAIRSSDAC